MQREVRCALLGGGMYGGDVVLRTIADLERCGIAPYLGSVGLDHFARELAGFSYRLVALGTRTERSARRVVGKYRELVPAAEVTPYWGERPWEAICSRKPDVVFVATPDDLHTEPTLCALEAGAHVVVEKPLCLDLSEADRILEHAQRKGLIVAVDMHKRYDPCHVFLFSRLVPRLGRLNYGRAVLEEPLEVASSTFTWAERSNPFCYVGVHWVDLFQYYLKVRPVSLHAVGQKHLLACSPERAVDTFDSMQVQVQYTGGLNVHYVTAWINPADFEGAVNQEMKLVGTRGMIEFDQQYRGLRAAIEGEGSRTYNPHFTCEVPRRDGTGAAYQGYGKDSLVAGCACATLVRAGLRRPERLQGAYPNAFEGRQAVGIIMAASEAARRNEALLSQGKGAPVTARFSSQGIEIVDPQAGSKWLYRGDPYCEGTV